MSVLYKALQKAEKENELRQSEAGFDTQRLAASGALKAPSGRGRQINRATMGAIIILAVGGGVGFLMFKDSLMPAPPAPPVVQRTVVETNVAAAPPAAPNAITPPVSTAPVAMETAPPVAPDTGAPAADAAAAQTLAAETPADEAPVEQQVAVAPVTPPAAAKPAARSAPEKPAPMPQIPVDSPARMLNPPIAINRAEYALGGVLGNQVQVREVSQAARSNVAAGYDALVRGSYDTALGFYDAALKDEPSSVLAFLGRGAALQKLGRGAEAQVSYDQVLKFDPQNREALTNLTAIVAERSPQDAVARLKELEHEYPSFSPIKAQIGLAYAKSGSMQPALEYLRRAVALTPNAAMYHYNLALVQDHLGQREQAIASYERVLDLMAGGATPEVSRTEIERRTRFLTAK